MKKSQACAFSSCSPSTGNSISLNEGLDISLPASSLNNGNSISIGIFGKNVKSWELESLLSTLDAVNWRIRDKDVSIKVFGNDVCIETTRPVKIEYFGWCGEKATLEALAQCDMFYCSNVLAKRHQEIIEQTSLSELPFLLAARQPVIYFGHDLCTGVQIVVQVLSSRLCQLQRRSQCGNL